MMPPCLLFWLPWTLWPPLRAAAWGAPLQTRRGTLNPARSSLFVDCTTAAGCYRCQLLLPTHRHCQCSSPSCATRRKAKYLYDGDCSMCLSLVSMLKRQDDGQVCVRVC